MLFKASFRSPSLVSLQSEWTSLLGFIEMFYHIKSHCCKCVIIYLILKIGFEEIFVQFFSLQPRVVFIRAPVWHINVQTSLINTSIGTINYMCKDQLRSKPNLNSNSMFRYKINGLWNYKAHCKIDYLFLILVSYSIKFLITIIK